MLLYEITGNISSSTPSTPEGNFTSGPITPQGMLIIITVHCTFSMHTLRKNGAILHPSNTTPAALLMVELCTQRSIFAPLKVQ